MLAALTALLLCQLIGETFVRLVGLPVPGPVLGLVLLLGLLALRNGIQGRKGIPGDLGPTANGLLKHLSLLFVPAGVGVVTYLGLIGDSVVPIVVALVGAWVITLLVTAGTASLLLKLRGGRAA